MKAGPGVKYNAFFKTTWNADACFDRDDLGLLARTMGLYAKQLHGYLLYYDSYENRPVLLSFVFSGIPIINGRPVRQSFTLNCPLTAEQ